MPALPSKWLLRFNEAAGIHRRKPSMTGVCRRPARKRFNEAAGIHRRKHRPQVMQRWHRSSTGFNEAAGIHRRKPARSSMLMACRRRVRFNEAAGIHRRKHPPPLIHDSPPVMIASMRPPEFTGGNALPT